MRQTGRSLTLTVDGKTWVWVTVLLGALGWYKSVALILLLAYFMAALLVLNAILARRQTRCLEAVREPHPGSHAGEETTICVRVVNTGTHPATAGIEAPGERPLHWLVHALPGGESLACAARVAFPRRGRFSGAPVRVASAYPFGLVRCVCTGDPTPPAIVLPALGRANAEGMRQWFQWGGGDGRARRLLRRVTTDQADVRGVRPYRPGDSIRSVHWRSTARRRELMVREYDAAPALELVLVVEPWLPESPTPQDLSGLEAALSLAATIASVWARTQETRITVAVAGRADLVRTTPPTEAGVGEALEPLADVAGAETFAVLSPGDFNRPLSRAVCVLVSSRPASPYADALTSSTGRPFRAVSPADRLPWYHPPAPGST